MAEVLPVFEPGERFATLDRQGNVVVWQVNNNGLPYDTLNNEAREAMLRPGRRGEKKPDG